MRIAGIDIGTNTCLMVIGEYGSLTGTIKVIEDIHNIGRLGEGVDGSGNISEAAIERISLILQGYRATIDDYSVAKALCVTTSAMRDARNGEEVRRHFERVLGFPVVIISGEEEGTMTFRGSVGEEGECTLLDIGGGSTEIIAGSRDQIYSVESLQIGAVRLKERFFSQLPPSRDEIEAAMLYCREMMNFSFPSQFTRKIIGVGGTFTTLAAMAEHITEFSPERIEGVFLSLETITSLRDTLLSMNEEQLRSHPCIHPKRADILPAGALILSQLLASLGADGCIVSIKGLRYGAMRVASMS